MKKITKILLNIFGVIFTLAGIVYMENYIVVALFLILGGLLLIPAIVTKILEKTKNNKIKSKYLYSIGIILVIIGCMFMPEQFVITKSANDELINKTQIKEGYIQYYGIKSARVALAPYEEMEIVEFIKNEELYPELFDYITTTKTYEDDTKIYKDTNDTITIIICGKESKEKNIIIGNNKLKYKKGFCGMNTIPKEKKEIASVKKEEKKKDNQENKTKKKKKNNKSIKSNYSNIKGLNNEQKQNFIKALKECNINPSNVKSLKKENDWNNGERYSFTYKGDVLWLYMYDDNTISSINLSLTGVHIYDEKYESLNYEDYYISSDNMITMEVSAEEQVGMHLKDESSAKYNWNSYQRSNEYFVISGTVKANNSFGQKVKSTVYVEFKLQNKTMNVIYIEINGKSMYGTKVVPQINRVERKNNDTSDKTSIILKDGVLGNYGKYDIMDGKQYIRYYIPIGKYKTTALVKNSMFYVESIAIHKENGYDTPTTYNTIKLKNKNDSQIIEVKEGQCISLVMGTRIKLEKIK